MNRRESLEHRSTGGTSNQRRSVRKRILVIDEDVDMRVMLWDRLEAMGFEVVTESNGLAGLSRIKQEVRGSSVDGVLLDLCLPVSDGIAVLEELRVRHPEIPVIVMTAAIHSSQLQKALKRGAIDYVVKPFDAAVLTKKTERVFLNK